MTLTACHAHHTVILTQLLVGFLENHGKRCPTREVYFTMIWEGKGATAIHEYATHPMNIHKTFFKIHNAGPLRCSLWDNWELNFPTKKQNCDFSLQWAWRVAFKRLFEIWRSKIRRIPYLRQTSQKSPGLGGSSNTWPNQHSRARNY